MQLKILSLFLTISLFLNLPLFGGFTGETPIKTKNGYTRIDQLKVGDKVICRDFKKGQECEKEIVKKKSRKFKKLICIIAGNNKIITAKKQKFYLPNTKKWKKAKKLRPGDKFLSGENDTLEIAEIKELDEEIELFDLSIKGKHNFRVSKEEILAHNFVSIPIGWLLGASAYEIVSCIVAAVGIFLAESILEEMGLGRLIPLLDLLKNPGKPTEKEGFKPKKNWDGKRVKNPHGHGAGYKDRRGNIWIPTGEGTKVPHWDTVNPKGENTNVYPGGKVRGPDRRW